MKKLIVCLLGMMITSNLSPTGADAIPEETHDIHLYMFGKGGDYVPSYSNPGNITTKAPNSTTDEYHIFYPRYEPSISDEIYYWYSDPLRSNVTVINDIHLTFWANCSSQRSISFTLMFARRKPDGSMHGFIKVTESKIVNNESVEFDVVFAEEEIYENDLQVFNIGDYIGIGIGASYDLPQPPAEVRLLLNSTNHPSHMTINTNSININTFNFTILNDKASIEVEITDAFGINDIADYDVRITDKLNIKISKLEINETKILKEGKINLQISWAKSGDGGGICSITITVIDNNDNRWERVETLEIDILDDGNELALSPNFLILLGIGIFAAILIYIFLSRKKKKQ